jgi:hypothetical protein
MRCPLAFFYCCVPAIACAWALEEPAAVQNEYHMTRRAVKTAYTLICNRCSPLSRPLLRFGADSINRLIFAVVSAMLPALAVIFFNVHEDALKTLIDVCCLLSAAV